QDRVGILAKLDGRIRHRLAGVLVMAGAGSALGEAEFQARRRRLDLAQHVERRRHHLRPDAVSGQHGDMEGAVGGHAGSGDGVQADGRLINTGPRSRARGGVMPRFAANLGYLFTEHPLLGRIDAAAAAGFAAIELQFPYDVPAAEVKSAIARNRLTVLGINSPPGREGTFGDAAVPGHEKDFYAQFARALDYIVAIGGSAVHCLAGMVAVEQRPAADRVYVENLKRAADLAAAKKIT